MPLLGQDKKDVFKTCLTLGCTSICYISAILISDYNFFTSTALVMGITLTMVLIPVLALTYTIASLIKVHGISLL